MIDSLPEYRRISIDRYNMRAREVLGEVINSNQWYCPRCGSVINLEQYGSDRCYECGELLEEL